nr:hypothetical protein BaRGS_025157 [Batillaria attramentaria]
MVMMRYKKEMDRRIRNCIIRMKGRIRQYGPGHCLGIADSVFVLETAGYSDWASRDDWCMAVFLFPNEAQAQLWYISEPELRQPDFLPPSNGIQLFATHLRYLPQPGKLTFNWEEFHNVRSNTYLQQEYVDKAAEMYDQNSINHGVIFVQDPSSPNQVARFKDSWLPYNAHSYCVLNLFDSEEHFFSIYNSDKHMQLREKRGEVCDTLSLLFTIDPDITGPPSTARC